MGSTSTTSGSGTTYTLTGGLILTGVAITVVATGKMLQHFVHRRGQTSQAANAGAEITGTGEQRPVRAQMNEIVPRASSGSPDGTATSGGPAVPTPSNNEMQVQVVIEVPPSLGHPTDTQNAIADVFTTTYRMVADYVFSTFASGTFC
ncbi:unnamed protein product [Sphagnum balticum]